MARIINVIVTASHLAVQGIGLQNDLDGRGDGQCAFRWAHTCCLATHALLARRQHGNASYQHAALH